MYDTCLKLIILIYCGGNDGKSRSLKVSNDKIEQDFVEFFWFLYDKTIWMDTS